MAQAFVDISNVAMRYGGIEGTLALKCTSLAVAEGEFVAVVGPSGCGKSTLMRLVTGLWPPTEGQVSVDGQEVDGPLSIAGMAFQNPTLLPWRNILDNVMLPLEVVQPHRGQLRAKRAEYEAQARELLALVGLNGFVEFSGQGACIACIFKLRVVEGPSFVLNGLCKVAHGTQKQCAALLGRLNVG